MSHEPPDARAIFLEAVEGVPAERWLDFIAEQCGDDDSLRERVQRLLDAHVEIGSFMDKPAVAAISTIDQTSLEQAGAQIGPYKLLQQIGEGGMGTVFLAEQTDPVKRQVALKVIKPGMDSRQVIARFEAERQALALMDHPHIARVFDAGTTASGRPYFVMELVKGIPLTKYCDDHRLTPRDRLALFIPVCQAIQHAHQKGVIHRDIKPSNVLVAIYDGKPVPKVIDFGVAKATGQRLNEQTLVTGLGSVVGTLEYMSPEQAELNQTDIDTRTDIYSLGVLLYELLTGSTPLEKKRLKEAAILEVLRLIREEEPPKPSTRLSTIEGMPSVAANRGLEPRKLSGLVRGELDWIVMKALEKDRNRRYETANGFAADVLRYLNEEPVLARTPSARYRLSKFVRRNRGPVLAVSLVLLALVVGVIGTWIGLLRARNAADLERHAKETAQRRLAQIEKANQILGSIFKELNPEASESEDKPLRAVLGERLNQATEQLEGEVIGDPLAVARMQVTLGISQLGLGYPENAIRLLSKARTTLTAQLGPDHPDTLESMNSLALGYQAAGKLALALPIFEETLSRSKAKLGPDRKETVTTMNNLAVAYQQAGKLELALPLFEETLKWRKAHLGPDHPHTLSSMDNLAVSYQYAGKTHMALPLFEETLRLSRAKLGSDRIDTISTINNLAWAYSISGKRDLGLPLFEEALGLIKAKLGPDHPKTLTSMHNLAMSYQVVGKFDKALPLFDETLKRAKVKLGPDHPSTVAMMSNAGTCYILAGQAAKAEPLLRECLAIRERKPVAPWVTFDTKSVLGAALLGQKKYSEAEPLLLAGYQGMKEREATITSTFKIRLVEALERLVQLYEAMGNKEKAKEWRKLQVEAPKKNTD
jgi:eukaryotic-like serine/threonine-protein kinase